MTLNIINIITVYIHLLT